MHARWGAPVKHAGGKHRAPMGAPPEKLDMYDAWEAAEAEMKAEAATSAAAEDDEEEAQEEERPDSDFIEVEVEGVPAEHVGLAHAVELDVGEIRRAPVLMISLWATCSDVTALVWRADLISAPAPRATGTCRRRTSRTCRYRHQRRP